MELCECGRKSGRPVSGFSKRVGSTDLSSKLHEARRRASRSSTTCLMKLGRKVSATNTLREPRNWPTALTPTLTQLHAAHSLTLTMAQDKGFENKSRLGLRPFLKGQEERFITNDIMTQVSGRLRGTGCAQGFHSCGSLHLRTHRRGSSSPAVSPCRQQD